MDLRPSTTAPGAGTTLTYVTSLLWRSKWLIIGATIVAVAVALALIPANTNQVWTGRTTLKVGMAPTVDYMSQGSGPALATLELPRNAAARMSTPEFREQVAGSAAFKSATPGASRSMVASSLRATVLDGDRDVSVELSATSPDDVKAAFRVVAAEIHQVHKEILDQRLKVLQSRIDDARSRIGMIEELNQPKNDHVIIDPTQDAKRTPLTPVVRPVPADYVSTWSQLQDRILSDTNLKQLSEPSVMQIEADITMLPPRPLETLRSSLLAGFGMLIAMIVLTIAVRSRACLPKGLST